MSGFIASMLFLGLIIYIFVHQLRQTLAMQSIYLPKWGMVIITFIILALFMTVPMNNRF